MKSLKVKIIDPIGLHARPATQFVKTANSFKSDIKVSLDGKQGNGKSVINLMALAIKCNSEIEIHANGIDEKEAIEGIKNFLTTTKLI